MIGAEEIWEAHVSSPPSLGTDPETRDFYRKNANFAYCFDDPSSINLYGGDGTT